MCKSAPIPPNGSHCKQSAMIDAYKVRPRTPSRGGSPERYPLGVAMHAYPGRVSFVPGALCSLRRGQATQADIPFSGEMQRNN